MVLRYAVRVNGLETVALTKLDVLDQCAAIKVCTAPALLGAVTLEAFGLAADPVQKILVPVTGLLL